VIYYFISINDLPIELERDDIYLSKESAEKDLNEMDLGRHDFKIFKIEVEECHS
jgi:hypothetical protein